MFDSPIFETVLSLILLMLVFSVLVSCVQEGYVSIRKSRGKMLEYAIKEVLNDKFNKNFAHLLYQHPQIDLLRKKQGDLPSYISSETFSKTLIDLIAQESIETVYRDAPDHKSMIKEERLKPAAKDQLEKFDRPVKINMDTPPHAIPLEDRFKLGIEMLHNSELKKLLLSFDANTPYRNAPAAYLTDLQVEIQKWYDGYMDRVTGWYKREVRTNLFVASLIVTLVLNLNFITVSKTIYADSKLREVLTQKAIQLAGQDNAIDSLKAKLTSEPSNLNDIDIDALLGTSLPIGWKEPIPCDKMTGNFSFEKAKCYVRHYITKEISIKNVMGWLLFTLGLTLGAPFWFDVLKKLVNMRNTGITPKP